MPACKKLFFCASHNLKARSGLLFCTVDGGTAWLMQSFDVGLDAVDSTQGGVETWRGLAEQLRHDLASIILMSEADLEVC